MRTPIILLLWLAAYLCVAMKISHRDTTTTRTDLRLPKRLEQCPEQLGAAIYNCTEDACGGQSVDFPGICEDTECPCNPVSGSSDQNFTTIIKTAVDAGTGDVATVTAVYVLETMTAFAELKQSLTTTTTHSSGSAIETMVAVIAPGGVVWVLSELIGDAVLEEVVVHSSPEVENSPEDTSCPAPKLACSDPACSGFRDMCTMESSTGCVCENKQCPSEGLNCMNCAGQHGQCTVGDAAGCACTCQTDRVQLQCSDQSCQGDKNDLCTVGADCSCCPDGFDTLDCAEDCGGDNGDETCTGLSDQSSKYKSCHCIGKNDPPPLGPEDGDYPTDQEIVDSWSSLPDITYSSFDFPPDREPVCQRFALAAPQRDGDGTPSVQAAIDDWCTRMDGVSVIRAPQGVDTVFQMWPFAFYSFWLSANNWYQGDPELCSDTVTVYHDDCVASLVKAMIECDPDSGATYGAAYVEDCIYFNITVAYGAYDQSPPWNPLPAEAISGSCDVTASSGIINSFWYNIAEIFCNEVDASNGAAVTKDYTSEDFNDPQRSRWRTPPPDGSMYAPQWGNPWFFHFEATFEETQNGGNVMCRKTCSDTIYLLTQSCGNAGGEQNCMAVEGSFDAGCRRYSYRISRPNTDETLCAVDWLPRGPSPFSVEQAMNAIEQFCSDNLAKVTMPQQPEPFIQDPLVDVSTFPQRSYAYGNTMLTIMAAFTDTMGIEVEGCGPDVNFAVNEYGDRCREVLSEAVNNCETDTTTQKLGGSLIEHEGDQGCVIWQIWASTLAIGKKETTH